MPYERDLEIGKIWEKKVSEWFRGLGYRVEHIVMYDEEGNETYQSYGYRDRYYSHPDILIEKEIDSVKITKYIEVKSFKDFYCNNSSQISEKILSSDKKYVFIHKYQFDSYQLFQELADCPVYLIIVIYGKDKWYWQECDILNKTKTYLFGNPYGNKESDEFYFWDKSCFKLLRR